MRSRTWIACFFCLAVSALPSTVAGQDVRERLTPEQRAELDDIEDQASFAVGLYVAAAVLTVGGLVSLLGGSFALLDCAPTDDCLGAELAAGLGGAGATAGMNVLVVATVVQQESEQRRQRLLRRVLALNVAPIRGGLMLSLIARH